jgi:hypothetical protein
MPKHGKNGRRNGSNGNGAHDPTNGDYTDQLCDLIACGSSIKAACAKLGIVESTFYRRYCRDQAFASAIARARVSQQDALVDETLAMADAATEEDWQVVRLRIWARQWHAAKLAPKKYGGNAEQTVNLNEKRTVRVTLVRSDQTREPPIDLDEPRLLES